MADEPETGVQAIVEALAASGITTSFVFGTARGLGAIWSVDVLTADGRSFDRPYGARSLRQAAEIARHECDVRGWHRRG